MTATEDRLFEVRGTVQGVGFRPFVARLAATLGLRGWVRNDRSGVAIRLEASVDQLADFAARVRAEAPAAARIAEVRERASGSIAGLPSVPLQGFRILDSAEDAVEISASVTPDLALCADCRCELADPTDRRRGYPFINCTQCGPRYSILESLPYDRPRTTMAAFTMCERCAREYADQTSRRFHAQPNACPECGPHVSFVDRHGAILAERTAAMAAAAEALRRGQIVAAKGIGGFHLFCDATNDAAVSQLRARKRRDEKPFAVMFASLADVERTAEVDAVEAALLRSPAAPIVLVRRRPAVSLAPAVAPGNPLIGALLAYSPLHVLLLEAVGRPVVATSGNLGEEPLCTENDEARRRLDGIADAYLVHDRPIAASVDDSVVRVVGARTIPLRRARGFAPSPLPLPPEAKSDEAILAVGGHLKNTVALNAGAGAVLSPHIGDLGNAVAIKAFRRTVALFRSLYGRPFSRVVCDAHPDYASTQFAESLGLPLTRVQHHLAHILACLLKHEGGPARVLGVAWDGSGYGGDGTVWGGEFIVVDRTARIARRVARLRPFRLPGGEAAVREGRRAALGLLHEVDSLDAELFDTEARRMGLDPHETAVLRRMIAHGIHSPRCSSVGRLFDGVAALLSIRQRSSFEGQAAMDLEFAAGLSHAPAAPWPMPLLPTSDGMLELDWRPMASEVLHSASDPKLAAARFHATLAAALVNTARAMEIETVVLTGGCFQNGLLLALATRDLEQAGHTVLSHRVLPPNDGGLSAGQLLGALWDICSVR